MILVTGGTGLVGSHLLYELCKSGKRVRAIKREGSNIKNVNKVFSYYNSNPDELLNNIEWVNADLLDVYTLEEALKDIEYVYHCAAMVSFNPKDEEQLMKINAEGTANLVNAALANNIKKLCHVSSIATIGNTPDNTPSNEETFWKSSPDNSKYSVSKYAAEREVWRASAEGLDVMIINPSLIIGPGNWQQSSSNMFNRAYKGIKFYTNGATGFVDVRDVATLALQLMYSNSKNERYILNSENKTYRYFFDLIHQQFGNPLPNINAGALLSSFAWRAEKVRCSLTGDNPLITKETAKSAHKQNSYSNKKVLDLFPDFRFITVEQSVKDTCALFLNE